MAQLKQLVSVLMMLLTLTTSAQVARVGVPRPKPQLTILGTITVTASPAAVNFALVSGGVAQGSSPITVVTTWTGLSLLATLNLYAFFGSSTQALSGGSPVIYIPSSDVLGQDTAGIPTAFTPFTQSSPLGGAGASLELYSTTTILGLGGTHTDNLSLQINLTSLPQLPAATYTGVLTLQAQAL